MDNMVLVIEIFITGDSGCSNGPHYFFQKFLNKINEELFRILIISKTDTKPYNGEKLTACSDGHPYS